MDIVGHVIGVAALLALAATTAADRRPRGLVATGGYGRAIWWAACGLLTASLAFGTGWWPIGIVVGGGGALAVARHVEGRWRIFVVAAAVVGALVGALAALWSGGAGLLLGAMAAALIARYTLSVELPAHGPAVATGLGAAIVAGPLLVWLDAGWTWLDALVALFAAAGVLTVGAWAFTRAFGPFDPRSPDDAHPFAGTPIEWAWIGAATSNDAIVSMRVRADVDPGELQLETDPGAVRVRDHGDRVVQAVITGLLPATRCRLSVSAPGAGRSAEVELTTFPLDGDVTIAASSCASTGSRAGVFDRIVAARPDVFVHLGDMHYENIGTNNPDRFHRAYDRVLASPAQARLFSQVPVAHIWDDHDFGPNNSDASSPSRPAAQQVYRQVEPHYELHGRPTGDGPGAIYQTFVLGRVQLVLTDTRSERQPRGGADRELLSSHQEEWLLDTVRGAKRDGRRLVVWCCATPWLGREDPARPDRDLWEGFPDQHHRVFEALRESGMALVFLCGDAHMIAIDDGTNSAPDGGVGFPIVNAASLDRHASTKGGRHHTHPRQPGSGQFALIRVPAASDRPIEITTHDAAGVVHRLSLSQTAFDAA